MEVIKFTNGHLTEKPKTELVAKVVKSYFVTDKKTGRQFPYFKLMVENAETQENYFAGVPAVNLEGVNLQDEIRILAYPKIEFDKENPKKYIFELKCVELVEILGNAKNKKVEKTT